MMPQTLTREQEREAFDFFAKLTGCTLWFLHDMEVTSSMAIFINPERGCIGCGYHQKEGSD